MVTQQELDIWLQEGIGAAKAGQYERARFRLLDVVEQDQGNEAAWFWLYKVFDRQDDKRICLENLVTLNPRNEWAIRELQPYLSATQQIRYNDQLAQQTAPANLLPPTMKLVTAFWAGISIIFLGGGIIGAGQWLVSYIPGGNFVSYITVSQLFELFIALAFIIIGVITVNVTIGLYLRSFVGFYASLLLALTLLFVGPFISLIATPPNYIASICTGGVPGMIVLLTLANPPESKLSQQKNDNRTRNQPNN